MITWVCCSVPVCLSVARCCASCCGWTRVLSCWGLGLAACRMCMWGSRKLHSHGAEVSLLESLAHLKAHRCSRSLKNPLADHALHVFIQNAQLDNA